MYHIDRYKIEKKINSGSYGKIYKVIRKSDNKSFASKVQSCSDGLIELDIVTRTYHRHIIHLVDFFIRKDEKISIILPLAVNDLQEYPLHTLDLSDKRRIIYEICSAVYFLTCNRILHLDLKMENILIFPDKSIKLTDFGISCYQVDNYYCRTSQKVFSEYNRPPEHFKDLVIDNNHIKCSSFSPRDDDRIITDQSCVWALGIIFYNILLDKKIDMFRCPIGCLEIIIFKLNILLSKLPDDESRTLISSMLQFEPNDRITLSNIFNHPFLSNYNYQLPISGVILQNPPRCLVITDISLCYKLSLCSYIGVNTEVFFSSVDLFYRTSVGFDPQLRFIACLVIASYLNTNYTCVVKDFMDNQSSIDFNQFYRVFKAIIYDLNGMLYQDNYYTISFSLQSLSKTIPYLVSRCEYYQYSLEQVKTQLIQLESIDDRENRLCKDTSIKELYYLLPQDLKQQYDLQSYKFGDDP